MAEVISVSGKDAKPGGQFSPGSVEDHREREKGAVVYPVFSRRSKGLSLGINLFPGRKCCSFDCPYCEVFPFETEMRFSIDIMHAALVESIGQARSSGIPVKDICFSGNGEPAASPHFAAALETAVRIREHHAPEAALVVITNGTGLLDDHIFGILRMHAHNAAFSIWLKIDAAAEFWYKKINRSTVPHGRLVARVREFAECAPFTVQTMLCAVDSLAPPEEEVRAWERLIVELACAGNGAGPGVSAKTGPRAVQLYGKARPAPEDPLASRVPETYLHGRAESLRRVLAAADIAIPVEVFP